MTGAKQAGFTQAGFTVVELVLVIVILAILAAVAAPRFFDNRTFSERAWLDEVSASLRFAQKVAVASGCRVRVSLGSGDYALSQQVPLAGHCDPGDSTFAVPVHLADGSLMTGNAPAGVTLAPPIVVIYDALGRTNLGADQSLAIGPWSFVIQAESGLVVTP